MTVTRSDPAVDDIMRIVAAETGLCFRSGCLDVEVGIQRAMARAGVDSVQQFAADLESRRRSIDDLVSELTVGETYFFRDPQQFHFIRHEVFPDVVRRRGAEHALRIWSAGCATGEEAYSLAITLSDAGLNGHILATDLSRPSLESARAASYRRWSLRGAVDALIQRCFHQRGSEWMLDGRFRSQVTFECHNLARAVYPSVPGGIWGMDLILCRNVLIYLDSDTVHRVAQALSETLAEGGWLITGPSDPTLNGIAGLSSVVMADGVYYRKRAAQVGTNLFPSSADSEASASATDRPTVLGHARDSCDRTSSDSSGDSAFRKTPSPLATERYARSLEMSQQAAEPASAALRIRAIANRHGSDAALKELATWLERFPLSTELHLLQGVLQMELGRHHEASQSLRRVLYLDRSLVIGHFLLATALRRQSRLEEARRAYRNARNLAVVYDPDERLPLADGERARTIAEAAHAEMTWLETRRAAAS